MDKKYQVFISSTFTDLIEERKKIQEILLMADCIPAGMEAFVATNEEQFNVIKKVIDLCDYYVLIVGGRYGSVNESTGLSYTEMEYDYAVENNIPVLVFCLDSSVDLPDEKKETTPDKQQKLLLFKEKAMKNRLASIWKNMAELSGQAAIAIMKAKADIDRPGWVRANVIGNYDGAELLSQINELRIENKELSEKLSVAQAKLSALDTFETSNIAFDDTPIQVNAHSINGGRSKSSNLRELYGVIALQMMEGFTSIETVEKTLCKFAGGSAVHSLDDPSLGRKLMNQFRALGLINVGPMGFTLTDLGRRVRDDITLIRKATQ